MTLYRVHRPQSFRALLGQDQARSLLQGSLLRQQIGHAYLFTGPRGTGKTTSARLFARAICCENLQLDQDNKHAEACGKCNACVSINRESATDLVEIDAASNRGIEDIRNLREQAQFLPVALKYRIYILDECHMLTNEAANALLKTLEEPPTQTIFILATTELHKVPLTIRSRCQLVRFKRGSIEAIAEKLLHIAKAQKIPLSASLAKQIAQHADGGFRDAETILEQLILLNTEITEETVKQLLGILPETEYVALEKSILLQDIDSITSSIDVMKSFEDVLRPSAITQTLIDRLRPHAATSLVAREAMQLLLEALILQKASPAPLLPLETALLRSTNQTQEKIYPTHRTQDSQQKIENSKTIAQKVVTTTTQQPVAPVIEIREKTAPTSDVRKAWKHLAEVLMSVDLPLAHLINTTQVHSVDADLVTVHAKYRFHVDKLNQKTVKQKILEALSKLTGEKWQLCVELNASMVARKPQKAITEAVTPENANTVFNP